MKTITKTNTSYSHISLNEIAFRVFSSQDIGIQSIQKNMIHVLEGSQINDVERDLLSAYLIQSLIKNDDIEGFDTDLAYAISMLQRAKDSIQTFIK